MTTVLYTCPECAGDVVDVEDHVVCTMVDGTGCTIHCPEYVEDEKCVVLTYDGYCPDCDMYYRDEDYLD